jgi:plastocyanin
MRATRSGLFGVAMAAALVAAACGGDNSSSSAPVSIAGKVNVHGTKDVKDGGSIEVETDDFYFGPTFIKGPAGAKVTVELHNEGKAKHTFTIDDQKVDQELDPDAKANVSVTLPSSGVLVYYCHFHRDQGMQGALFTA